MKDKHNLPKAHERIKAIKKHIDTPAIRSTINRFQYRYRIARAFEGIIAPDIGKKTIDGYAAGMKLLLAYGAFDEIRLVRNSLPNIKPAKGEYVKIHNAKLASKLRGLEELKHLLSIPTAVKNPNLQKDVAHFFDGNNDDVMCIATGLRNAFAHGVFTAAGAGLKTKTKTKYIEELANTLLDMTDEIANQCMSEYEKANQ